MTTRTFSAGVSPVTLSERRPLSILQVSAFAQNIDAAGVRLAGPAREHSRLPCFWFRDGVGVLPAFGEFTGLADVAVSPGDRVWVTAGDTVIDVSP